MKIYGLYCHLEMPMIQLLATGATSRSVIERLNQSRPPVAPDRYYHVFMVDHNDFCWPLVFNGTDGWQIRRPL